MPLIVPERPANSGLLYFGVPSLCSRFPGIIQRKSLANIANIPVFRRRRPETGFDQGMRGEVGSDLLIEDGERGVQVLDRPKPFLSVRHGTQALAAQLGRPFYGCFANLL
jgi:hypothetical protein